MRILWFTGRVKKNNQSFYGGGGWIRSLSSELSKKDDMTLAQAFFSDEKGEKAIFNDVACYPMWLKPKNKIKKMLDYWLVKPEYPEAYLLENMLKVIEDFRPDVIQIFGTESMFTSIIGKTKIPVVLYMQGLLNPIYNAFYPYSVNRHTIKYWKFDKHEWIYNNGRLYRERLLCQLAKNEREVLSRTKYIIGRTHFDYNVTRLFAPKSIYYKVSEMMREPFYEGRIWTRPGNKQYRILSTLSNVTYKGLDVILKTALLLSEKGIDFIWNIVGVGSDSDIIKLIERVTNISSNQVHINYLGIKGEKEIKELLLQSHVFVHPSYIDNSPNSVGEAQLLGVPVIACYVGGVPEFIKPQLTGELIPANDPFNLAYIIIKDFKEPYLHKYSEPAYIDARIEHDKESIIREIINVYTDIIEADDGK